MYKKNIFSDKRSLADDAYVSLYEAYYLANGSKVRTLTMFHAERPPFNLKCSNKEKLFLSEEKYPGALVIKPYKGLIKPKLSIVERVKKTLEIKASPATTIYDHRWDMPIEVLNKRLVIWNELQRRIGTYIPKGIPRFELTKALKSVCVDQKTVGNNVLNVFNAAISFFANYICGSSMHQKYKDVIKAKAIHMTLADIEKILTKISNSDNNNNSDKLHFIKDTLTYGAFIDYLEELSVYPLIALDFASLYPSVMMSKNISPEKCIESEIIAKKVNKNGQKLIRSSFMFGGEVKNYWFIQHQNEYNIENKEFAMGVFPYVLKKLFDKRQVLKNELAKIKEEIETATATGKHELLEDLQFLYDYTNGKQSSVKIFMNTFYGETGNKKSIFFLLGVAGSVTAYGRDSLKTAYEHVLHSGCRVIYGDTDSLYINMPMHTFLETDIEYYCHYETYDESVNDPKVKVAYATHLVELTRIEGMKLRDEINALFEKKNGNKFLKMAYEEVLFPVHMAGKKKYIGIPHEKHTDFNVGVAKFFIRGIDVRRRGICKFQKDTINELMTSFMSLENLYEPIDIIHNLLNNLFQRKLSPEVFAKSDAYRRDKKNVKVLTYKERMEKERGMVLKPIERFWYIICEKPPFHYIMGKKIKVKIGELMEPLEAVLNGDYVPNFTHYVESCLTSMSRFISYLPAFNINKPDTINFDFDNIDIDNDPRLVDSTEDSKKEDQLAVKEGIKYLRTKIDKYKPKYHTFGEIYRTAFKEISVEFTSRMKEYDPFMFEFLSKKIKISKLDEHIQKKIIDVIFDNEKYEQRGQQIISTVLSINNRSERKELMAKLRQLCYMRKGGDNLLAEVNERYSIEKIKIMKEMNSVRSKLNSVINEYDRSVSILSTKLRKSIVIPDELTKAIRDENAVARNITAEEIKLTNLPSVKEDADKLFDELVNSDNYIDVVNQFKTLIINQIVLERDKLLIESMYQYLDEQFSNETRSSLILPTETTKKLITNIQDNDDTDYTSLLGISANSN
jgi:hypothetical protein